MSDPSRAPEGTAPTAEVLASAISAAVHRAAVLYDYRQHDALFWLASHLPALLAADADANIQRQNAAILERERDQALQALDSIKPKTYCSHCDDWYTTEHIAFGVHAPTTAGRE